MAVKFPAGRGLILGLLVAALGVALVADMAEAGRKERRARKAPEVPAATDEARPQAEQKRPRSEPEVPRPEVARSDSTPPDALPPEQVAAIARAQRCWAELGYYKAEIDGKRGRATRSAFSQFKREHGLANESDILAVTVQQKIAELCKTGQDGAPLDAANDPLAPQQGADTAGAQTPGEAALVPPETGDPSGGDVAYEADAEAVEPQAAGPRLDLDCLGEDLLAVLRRAHGLGVDVPTCDRACVMPPAGLPQAQIDAMQAAGSVVWCRSCVTISGQLPLSDVKRVERAGNIALCPIPPRQLAKYGEGVTDGLRSYLRVRELYRALPPMAEDPGQYAVIIGNRSYDRLPRSVTSYNDADAFYAFLTERLGFRPDNIIDLRDAKKADFERVFGAEPGVDGELARRVEAKPDTKIVVYYSGHGATDEAQTETYLLPVDAEPYQEAVGGYRLATLYANLAKLKANSVLVLLETEFGSDHGAYVLPPNLPETVKSALPQDALSGLTVLAATDRGQRSLPDPTYDIGLFTRYVIEGLAGAADLPPVGNGNGRLDTAEIYAFTAAFVDLVARKTYGVLQRPVYSGAATNVLTSATTPPARSN
ncbi:MAG TPA: caspase family protein [Methyloceanibacter sp.]|nr:caspase family protein [Methyloceanibacter sp.]